MTRIRPPQVTRAEVLVHLVAADFHHLPAEIFFILAEQVVNERVRAGEIVIVRHAGFVVVAIARAAFGVPFGAFEQNSFGFDAVLFRPAEQPGEREGRGTV